MLQPYGRGRSDLRLGSSFLVERLVSRPRLQPRGPEVALLRAIELVNELDGKAACLCQARRPRLIAGSVLTQNE